MRSFTAIEARIVDGLWKKAENAAETDEQLANLKRTELSWRWWKASAGKCEFSFFSRKRAAEKEKLYEDLLASGVIDFAEFSAEDVRAIDKEVIRYATPDQWHVGSEDNENCQTQMKIEKLAERFPPLFGIVAFFYTMTHS
jgi:hypothetical protein